MTYKELLEELKQLPQEKLDDIVTAFDPYEMDYIPVIDTFTTDEATSEVIESGRFILNLKG